LENSENYFHKGSFDMFDLAAIAFGTAMACLARLAAIRRRKTA